MFLKENKKRNYEIPDKGKWNQKKGREVSEVNEEKEEKIKNEVDYRAETPREKYYSNNRNIDYSPHKDIIQEKISNYNSYRGEKKPNLQSPYATHSYNEDEVYEKKKFESSQLGEKDSLTEYSLPTSSQYHSYNPRVTRIE